MKLTVFDPSGSYQIYYTAVITNSNGDLVDLENNFNREALLEVTCSGTYSLEITNITNTCPVLYTPILNFPPCYTNNIQTNLSACQGTSVTLGNCSDVFSNATISWKYKLNLGDPWIARPETSTCITDIADIGGNLQVNGGLRNKLISVDGGYYQRVVTSNNCPSHTVESNILFLDVKINPTASVAPGTSPICSGGTANFNLSGAPGAIVTYKINGVSYPPTTLNSLGTSVVNIPNAPNNQTLTLVSASLNGCSQSLNGSATVPVNSLPTVSNAGIDQNICGTSTSLVANSPTVGNGTWSILSGAGGSITTPGSPTSTFSGVSGSSYTLRWTISNSPCISSTDDVVISFNAAPTTANAGADQTGLSTCGLTAVSLAANTPGIGTGTWSIQSGTGGSITSVNSANSTFSGVAGNSYILRWTINSSSCTPSFDEVTITFNRNPTISNAGIDQNICGTSTSLVANSPTVGNGTWSILSGAGGSITTPGSPTSTFSGVSGSSYTLRWTISNSPCISSTDDVVITFNAAPTTANAGADQTGLSTCGLTSVTLAANTPGIGTGTWSIQSGTGGSITSVNSANSTFSGVAGNSYILRWTINSPSCTPSFDEVTITFNRNPTISNAGIDQNICGTSTSLVANSPTVGNGTWSILSGAGGSITTPGSPTSTFSGVSGTSYTLRWTISNSPCISSTDDVVITFNAAPTTANAGADQTGLSTCGLTSVSLAANTPAIGTGTWSIQSGTGGSITSVNSANSTFSGVAGNSYILRWTINTPSCTPSFDEVTITFNRNPTISNAGIDQNICGTSTSLVANSPTVGNGTWSILSGAGGSITTPGSPTSTFSGVSGSSYTLRWTISNSPCISSTDDVVITFNAAPTTANAGADQTGLSTCGLTSVTLAANTPAIGSGTWSIQSGTGGSITSVNSANSTFSGVAGNSYVLRWTINSSSCTPSFDEVTITFNRNPTISNAGIDQNICGTSTSLVANSPTVGNGTWSILSGAGGSITTPGSPTSTFSGVSGSSYTLRWTISNSPCISSTDDVVITFNAAPTTANAGADQTGLSTCGLTSVTLAANTPGIGTGTWSIQSGTGGSITSVNSANSTFSGVAGNSYVLRWTINSSSCTPSFDEVTITFNRNPTISNAGIDQNICGTSTSLVANSPTVGNGTWSILSGAGGSITTPGSPTSTFSGVSGSSYTLRWTISNSPCISSTDDVVITFNAAPTTANAGLDQTICGTSTILSGNVPLTGAGNWSIISGSGGSITSPGTPTSTFSGVSGSSYTLRWTISNSPCISSTDDVVITFNAAPTTANAGADQTGLSTCGLTSVTLAANTPGIGTGTWSIQSGTGGSITSVNSANSTFSGVAGNSYILRWTINSPSCTPSFDEVTITFNRNPTISNAGIDQNICGTSTSLVANSPTVGNGTWSILSGAGGSITTPGSPTSTFSGVSGSSYTLRWTISNSPCISSTDNVVITFNTAPTTANAGADQTICGTSTSLSGNVPSAGTGNWSIISGSGGSITSPGTPTSTFNGIAGTTYTLRWTISNSPCVASTDDVVITFNAAPTTANAGLDQTICGTSTGLSGNIPSAGTGNWSIISGSGGSIITPGSPTSTFSGVSGTSYTLRWTINNNTCISSTDDVVITFNAAPTTANAGLDQTICGTSTGLSGNIPSAGTGNWSIISGSGGSITSPGSPTSTFNGVSGTSYTLRWTISNNPCISSTDDVVITFNAAPTTANAGLDQTICGTSTGLSGNIPSAGTGAWSIISGSGGSITSPGTPTSTFSGVSGTSYTLRWTISNSPCISSTDNVVITFNAAPTTANAGADQTGLSTCGLTSVTLAANTPAIGTGTWSIQSGTGGSITSVNSANSTFSGVAGNSYVLRWTINSSSCTPSFDEVTITFNRNPTISNAGIDQNICGTSTSLVANSPTVGNGTWSILSGAGGSITTPGSPTSTFSGVSGSSYTLRWTISNSPCISSTDNVVITFNTAPTTANAGADQTICGTSTSLSGNVPSAGTGNWSIISGSGGSITSPGTPTSTFNGIAGTTYTLRWTISNSPCVASTDDVVITFNAAPTTANAGLDQTICGTSTGLSGNIPSAGTGNWSIISGSGGSIITPGSPTSTFSGVSGTSYTLRWTISNNPCISSTDDVVITFNAAPITANAGLDQTICGTSTGLSGNIPSAGTGNWSIISGSGGSITSPGSPTSTFNGVSGTRYTLRWTISNSPCISSTDDVVITFNVAPTTANAGLDQTICGTSTGLSGNIPSAGTGNWSIISGSGGSIITPGSPTSTFGGVSGTSYTLRWTISNNPCISSTDDVVITFNAAPTTANAGLDQTICGTSTGLSGNIPSAGTGNWSIISGSGGSITSPGSPTSTFNGIAGTKYTLRWTINNSPCAASTDDVVITFNAAPTTANAGLDQTICGTSTGLSGNVPSAGTGNWSIISGSGGSITTPGSPTSTFSGVSGTSYTLRWTISNSPCISSTDDVVITFNAAPTTANAGLDQTICGTSTSLSGNVPLTGTGAWSIISGSGGSITSPGTPTSAFNGIAGTTYTLRWTINNSPCAATTDDVVIAFNAAPTTANAGLDQTICGTSTGLSGNVPLTGTGNWSIISGSGGSITSPGTPTSTFNGIAGTTYTLRWTISNSPCFASTDDVVITFNAAPTTANAGADQTGLSICGLTSVTLAANTPAIGTGTWSIQSGTGGSITSVNSANSTFSGVAGNSYVLRWTINSPTCTPSFDEVTITFNRNPTISNAGIDQNICGTSTSLVANSPTVGNGTWSILSGAGGRITTPGSPTSTFSGVSGTSYTLRWTISNSPCVASTDDVVITFNAAPTTANAGLDQTICGTSTGLSGNIPSSGTGNWSIISGSGGSITSPGSPTSTFNGIAGTTYTLRWTISNSPCISSTDDVAITFNAAPTTANAGLDQTICGTSTSLSGNVPLTGTGNWSIISGSGGSMTTPGSATSTFNGASGTSYTLRWTISNSPCISSTDDVVITFNASPTTANAGLDQTICGTSTGLSGNIPSSGTGNWSIISGSGGSITSPGSPTSTFNGIAGTTYTLRWTISNSPCISSTDDVVITFNAAPTTANAGLDQTICGTSTSLAGNVPLTGTGAWSIISGSGGSITSPGTPTSTFNGIAGTTYTLRWTISNSPCISSTDDVAITFNAAPTTANAGLDQTICGTSTSLSGNVPLTGTGNWSIISGSGGSMTTPGSATSTFNAASGTSYTLRWTISNSPCISSTDDVVITFNASPTTANAGLDQTICGTSTSLAGNVPLTGTGAWSIISGSGGSITSPGSPTSTFNGIAGTTYTLRWTISNSPCISSTDDVVIKFNATPTTANAGLDQTICGTSTGLSGNIPSAGTGNWSIISGSGGSITSPGTPTSTFNGIAGTTYTLRWTINNSPCAASTDDVVITFNAAPTTANAGLDQTICGTSTGLSGNVPLTGTGNWSIISGSGGSITSPGTPTSTFNGIAGTTYTLRWTISNSPCFASTDDVVITFNAAPTTANAGADQTGLSTCGLTAVSLAANTPAIGTGTWSIQSGTGGSITSVNSANSTFNGVAGNTYVLRWTINSPSCTPSFDEVIITFNRNPTISNAGIDQNICGTSTSLVANSPTVGNGTWSILSGSGGSITTPGSPTSTFNGIAGTTYTLRWTISNSPCVASTDDVVITFNAAPTTANAGLDQTICGTSTSLAGNVPLTGTGNWSIISGSGGSITSPGTPTSTFNGIAGTTYTLRWTINNSPCFASTDDVVITFNAAPTTANAGLDQTICGTSTSLSGNVPLTGTGNWSIISGSGGSITTPGSPTSTFNGVSGTSYTLRWTISNSPCISSTDDVVITFNAAPTTANAGLDQTICGTSTSLSGNVPLTGTGNWSIISGSGGSITSPGSPTSTFNGIAGTTYTLRWTISNSPCISSTDDVVITFNATPTTANAGLDQTICGTSTGLSGNIPSAGTGNWSIISGSGGSITSPGTPTSTFNGIAGTTYTLRWTINNSPCAASTDDVVITFNAAPTTANAGLDQTICGTSTSLSGNVPLTGTGNWSIISGSGGSITTPGSPTSTFNGVSGTSYTLRWTISNSPCISSTDDVVITFNAAPTTANAGADQTGLSTCGLTSVTLAANTPGIGTGTWSIQSGTGGSITSVNSANSTFSGVAGNTYVLRWTINSSSCTPSFDEVTITFNRNPTISNAGIDQNICGTSTSLVANSPTVGNGTWSILSGAGGSIITPGSPTSTISGVSGTSYTLRWTISNSPCFASTDDVVITFNAAPTTANAGLDQTICGTSTGLSGNIPSAGTGNWSIISGSGGSITSPGTPTSTFNGIAGTTYTLRWTINNSPCAASTDDVVITFNAAPTTANAGLDQTICGTSTSLSGNVPLTGTGNWSIISGSGGSITSPGSPTSTFNGASGTSYTLRWTISNSPCISSTDDVVITFNASPTTANAGLDQTICGTSTGLSGNVPSAGTGNWSIISGSGGSITTPGSPTSTFNGVSGTSYTLRWTISNSPCISSTDDVVITFNAAPTTANAGADQTGLSTCGLTSVTLAANTPGIGTGTWSIQSGTGGSITSVNSANSTFSGVAGNTYVLRWTINSSTCTPSFDEVTITFNRNPTISNAGIDQNICGTSTSLVANSPTVGNGTWSILSGAGGSIITPGSPTSTLSGVSGTSYTLRWTISNSPCISSTDDVVITFNAAPTTANAGADQTGLSTCGLTSVTLAANTPAIGTGTWSIQSGTGGSITSVNSANSTFSGVAGNSYVLRWTINSPSCTPSFDEVTITFNRNPTISNAGIDQNICGTSTSLVANSPTVGNGTWSILSGAGGSITTPGSPTSTFSGVSGSSYTLRWTISNSPCISSTDDVVITFNAAPTTANAGLDQTICGTSTSLAGNVPLTGTGAWSIISGSGGSITSPGTPTSTFNGIAGTTYTLRWTINNSPCVASTDDVVIIFNAAITTANAGADQTICGTNTSLTGNVPLTGTGNWSIISGSGGSITSPGTPTSTFNGIAGTTYTLRWAINNSPCAASTDDVVITFNAAPTTANAGLDQTICGTSTSLSGNVPLTGTGNWSIISGSGGSITSPGTPTSTFNGIAGITYTLRWTISNSPCVASTDDVVITFNAAPTTANAGLDQTICGTSTSLSGNVPLTGTGNWSIISGSGGSITSPGTPTSTFNGIAGTTYTLRWTISNSPCISSADDVVITFNAAPTTANAGLDQTICGTSTGLSGNVPLTGTGNWSIISGSGGSMTTPGSATSTFNGASGTSYTLRWTISNSPCISSTDDVVITFNASPTTANAGLDQTICGTSTGLSSNVPSAGTGNWSIINGSGGSITSPGTPTSTFNGIAGTTYTLRWTISNSPCVASTDDVVITFNAAPTTANAGLDQTICGTSTGLSGNVPTTGTGNWRIVSGNGGTIVSPSLPTSTFNGIAGNTYTLRWTISNSPCAVSTDDIVIHFISNPNILVDSIKCSNDLFTYSVFFTSNGNITNTAAGTIIGNTVINIPFNSNITVTTTLNGCTNNIVVNAPNCSCPAVPAPTSNGNQTICSGQAIPALSVTVGANTTVDWYNTASGGTPILSNNTSYVPISAGTYYAQARNSINNCISNSRSAVTLTINALPTLSLGATDCSADLLTYTATITTNGTITNTTAGTISGNTVINIPANSNITVTTTLNGCTNSIFVNAPNCSCPAVPAPTSNGNQTICAGQTIPTLSVTVGANTTVDWYNTASGGTPILSNNTSYVPISAGTYYAQARNSINNCISSSRAAVTLTINALPTISLGTTDCSADLLTYTATITTNGTITNTTAGTISGNTVINIPKNAATKITTTLNGCTNSLLVNAPTCICTPPEPPQTTGNISLCDGDSIPPLKVLSSPNSIINWFDSLNNLLKENSETFFTNIEGSYFAESKDTITGCVSVTRTKVTLSIAKINYQIESIACGVDLSFWTVKINTILPFTFSKGILENGNVLILPSSQKEVSLTFSNGSCDSTIRLNAPACFCDFEAIVNIENVILCPILNKGKIQFEVNVPNTNKEIEYSINNGITWTKNSIFNNLDTGKYSAMIRNVYCTKTLQNVQIKLVDSVKITAVVDTPNCDNVNGGSIKLFVHGGDEKYTYLWDNGMTIKDRADLDSGLYTIEIKDQTGCLAKQTFVLKQKGMVSLNLDSLKKIIVCSEGYYPIHLPDTFKYLWYGPKGFQSDSNKVILKDSGRYDVFVFNKQDCMKHDSIQVLYSKEFFNAKFVLPSEGLLNSIVIAAEISWPIPDSIKWQYDVTAMSLEGVNLNQARFKLLKTGTYFVKMTAYKFGCQMIVEKSISIVADSSQLSNSPGNTINNLKNVKLFPNPNAGIFNVEITLDDPVDVIVRVYDIAGNNRAAKLLKGNSSYLEKFELDQLPNGIYTLLVQSGTEYQTVQFIIQK